MKVWANQNYIRKEVADVPQGWLTEFAVNQPEDIRKFGDARNSSLDYRVAAVLEAIEAKKYFRKAN